MPYIHDESPCSPINLHHLHHPQKMGFLSSLRHKSSRKNTDLSTASTSISSTHSPSSRMAKNNFSAFTAAPPSSFNSPSPASIPTPARTTPSGTTPTRRPPPPEAPPAYQEAITSVTDDQLAFLRDFDIVAVIDDSGSMAGRSWRETRDALMAIAPIITQYDDDGIDIYFFNYPDHPSHHNVTSAAQVEAIFNKVQPRGGTPTGTKLNTIIKPYLREIEAKGIDNKKPLNIIVITDGVPSDDPESVILAACKKLDKWDAPSHQIGIQFFQVGNEPGAAESLRELDDELGGDDVRDIVDTVPWNGSGLSAMGMLKVLLGSVVRKLDRKKGSLELTR